MQSGHGLEGQIPKQRHLERIDVEMQDVKKVCAAPQLIEHNHVVRYVILNIRIEAYRCSRAGDETRRCRRIAASEQSDIMAQPNQLLAQMRDDAFRPPVESWRHTFHQWGYLRDFHRVVLWRRTARD